MLLELGMVSKRRVGILTNEEAIVVLVGKKVHASTLAKSEIIPKLINGFVSDVLEVGHIKASNHTVKTRKPYLIRFGNFSFCRFRKSRCRPAPGGISIGHYKITAGTLGAVVYDCRTGKSLILSNNHVLANETNGKDCRAKKGDPILQPGPLDGGTVEKDTIAKLYRFVPLKDCKKNVVDAAVAKPLRPYLIVPYILGIGCVKGTVLPRIGMCVQKSGRTTCATQARIRCIDMIVKVEYDEDRVLTFKRQILVENFDEPGDSGSLVLDLENKTVGLLFAGSEKYTFVNPINPVLDFLKVRF